MFEGQLFLKYLKYYTDSLHRITEFQFNILERQFNSYKAVCEVFKPYKFYECKRKIRKNNSFKFDLSFYKKHKDFLNLLNTIKYNGKKCYTVTKRCIYVNDKIFSKDNLRLIDYDNLIYENIGKDFLYVLCIARWQAVTEFQYRYISDLKEFYKLTIPHTQIDLELKKTALAALPYLFKLMWKKPHTCFFLKEFYATYFLK